MTSRKLPPIIKIYEALWAIADDRIEILPQEWLFIDPNFVKAKVYSSSKWKHYEVQYDKNQNAIMANDNASYRQWYLWYPGIALLLKLNVLAYNEIFAAYIKDIPRKDINAKNKDSEKTLQEIDLKIMAAWGDINQFKEYIVKLAWGIAELNLSLLGNKKSPPKWY